MTLMVFHIADLQTMLWVDRVWPFSSEKSRSKPSDRWRHERGNNKHHFAFISEDVHSQSKQRDEAVEMIDVRYCCEREGQRKVGAVNSQKEWKRKDPDHRSRHDF